MNQTDTIDVEDRTLVALSPADMAPAQRELSTWCDQKVAAVKTELRDLETNLELATEHGWKHTSVVTSINRAQKRVLFYEKIKAAVDAGYLIVPNFPVDVFAVRVQRAKPRETVSDSKWGGFRASAELLPAGEGRYVDESLVYRDESSVEKLPDGKERLHKRYVMDSYDDVDFPVVAVKPAVLAAAQRAMALKVFDEMGMVQNNASGRRGDPIIVGRLRDPRGQRVVTFFVAWWLDTATL